MKSQNPHSTGFSESKIKDNNFSAPGTLIIRSKGKDLICLFDPEDYELICRYNWRLHTEGYATASRNHKTILMHRLVLGLTKREIQADHRYFNKLDNRKKNLRVCTCAENRRNSQKHKLNAQSRYKGVYLDGGRYWHVQIMQDGKVRNLGCFNNEIDAAKRYDSIARLLFGEFANLNFPLDRPPVQMLIEWL